MDYFSRRLQSHVGAFKSIFSEHGIPYQVQSIDLLLETFYTSLFVSLDSVLLNNWGRCCVSVHEVLFKFVACEMHVGH